MMDTIDLETRREKGKVPVRRHELRSTRHTSEETEEAGQGETLLSLASLNTDKQHDSKPFYTTDRVPSLSIPPLYPAPVLPSYPFLLLRLSTFVLSLSLFLPLLCVWPD